MSAATDLPGVGTTGWIPDKTHFAPGLWPAGAPPPFVYDFTADNAALASVTGTDAQSLQGFTDMMFGPISYSSDSSGSSSASQQQSLADPEADAATYGHKYPPGNARIGWGRYAEVSYQDV
jgi:hypothetical protein